MCFGDRRNDGISENGGEFFLCWINCWMVVSVWLTHQDLSALQEGGSVYWELNIRGNTWLVDQTWVSINMDPVQLRTKAEIVVGMPIGRGKWLSGKMVIW